MYYTIVALFFLIAILLSFGFVSESEALRNYTSPQPDYIFVELDKQSYVIGEIIIISGNVETYHNGAHALIILYSPDKRIVSTFRPDVNFDKEFTLSIDTTNFTKTGVYYIKSSYGSSSEISKINFEINPFVEHDENIDVASMLSESENSLSVQSVSTQEIPSWVKNNVEWWADDLIDDGEFTHGIEFLINENILILPPTIMTDEQLNKIPDWIKNNGKWWTQGIISDDEFLSNIQYLIVNGILSVNLIDTIEPN